MLLLISGMCVCAQTHSYASFMMADHAMPGDPSVARHWKGDCVVASFYNIDYTRWYLGILRVHGFMSGSISYDTLCVFETPPVMRIMDLYVVGDTTYFCGTIYGAGMYGWFRNDTVVGASVYYHTTMVMQLDTLKRLVVHRKASDGSMHLSAIGVNSATGGQYILEAADAAASGMQSYSLAAVTEAEGTHEEVLDDVLLTDGHVVFVSRDRRGGVGPVCFRRSLPDNVLGSTMVNIHFRMPSVPDEAGCAVSGTPLEGDWFAVGYAAGNATEARVHRLDAGGSGITLLGSQWTAVCQDMPVADIAYHRMTGKLTMLWPEAGGNSHFLVFSPYAAGVQAASHITPTRIRMRTVDDMGGTAFLAWGGNGVMLQRTSGSLNTCPLVQCSGCSQETVTTYEANPVTGVNAPLAVKSYKESVYPISYLVVEGNSIHSYCKP